VQYETYGKWILAGEHAVLRGVPAIVFPLLSKCIKFNYSKGVGALQIHIDGDSSREAELIFPGLLDAALKRVNKTRVDITGTLTVESRLPLGAGLGASAAYCVGVARLFVLQGWLSETEIYEFSRQLENLFHGESSGVDIAAALRSKPTLFVRGGEQNEVLMKWKPRWYLSSCGKRGVTSECVLKVKSLWGVNPQRAEKIDNEMRSAVDEALMALTEDEAVGHSRLARAIDRARDCFYQWNLCDGSLDEHMRWLTNNGALSVKPTGSGGGGYVLSLWTDEPKVEIHSKLIKLN
jgi:mevalonate kinase